MASRTLQPGTWLTHPSDKHPGRHCKSPSWAPTAGASCFVAQTWGVALQQLKQRWQLAAFCSCLGNQTGQITSNKEETYHMRTIYLYIYIIDIWQSCIEHCMMNIWVLCEYVPDKIPVATHAMTRGGSSPIRSSMLCWSVWNSLLLLP